MPQHHASYNPQVDEHATSQTIRVTIGQPSLLARVVFVLIAIVGLAITMLVIIPAGLLIALVVYGLVLIERLRRHIARLINPNSPSQGRRNVRVISRDTP